MSNLIPTILIAALIISCAPADKKNDASKEIQLKDVNSEQSIDEDKAPFKAIDSDEALLATALMAAPKESRDSCKVIGYTMKGEWQTFREGTNEFIVIADNPKKEGFSAACYHKSLEPFMARGRALKAEGKSRDEIFDIRGSEIKSGALQMGNAGSTLHIYYGSNESYNPKTSEVEDARYRYVVYLPYATPESTGLPIQPVASNHPWIMDPGTHRAHIMITPMASASMD